MVSWSGVGQPLDDETAARRTSDVGLHAPVDAPTQGPGPVAVRGRQQLLRTALVGVQDAPPGEQPRLPTHEVQPAHLALGTDSAQAAATAFRPPQSTASNPQKAVEIQRRLTEFSPDTLTKLACVGEFVKVATGADERRAPLRPPCRRPRRYGHVHASPGGDEERPALTGRHGPLGPTTERSLTSSSQSQPRIATRSRNENLVTPLWTTRGNEGALTVRELSPLR